MFLNGNFGELFCEQVDNDNLRVFIYFYLHYLSLETDYQAMGEIGFLNERNYVYSSKITT